MNVIARVQTNARLRFAEGLAKNLQASGKEAAIQEIVKCGISRTHAEMAWERLARKEAGR